MEVNELLKKIKRLEIRTKGLTKHIFSGEYHSAFKGRGMAFSEVRNYQYGDEVRTIDWNVTARYNSPHVKIFEEERELTVMLVVDISGSSEYGTTVKSKKDLAIELCAVLAFSAIQNNDKVGAIFISDHVEKYIAPEKGRQHALTILRQLIEFQPKAATTHLSEGLKFLRNTQKQRTISFVISDFIDDGDFMDSLRITRKRHDTIALKVSDAAEYDLPAMGIIQLFNAETKETTWINSSSDLAKNSLKKHREEREQLLKLDMRKSGIDFVTISTDEDFIPPLVRLFKSRA
ncbi:MAG: DUF58 domain-containing protein [Bacteroidota bacterium]